jgi:hypothetical protein
LNANRNVLDVQRAEIHGAQIVYSKQAQNAVKDYCGEAATNLAGFTVERWREFLRVIVHSIVFRGDRITIHGQIPIAVFTWIFL